MGLFTIGATSSLSLTSTGILAASGVLTEPQILTNIQSTQTLLQDDPYLQRGLDTFRGHLQPLTSLTTDQLHPETDAAVIRARAIEVLDHGHELATEGKASDQSPRLQQLIEEKLMEMRAALSPEALAGSATVVDTSSVAGTSAVVGESTPLDVIAAVQLNTDPGENVEPEISHLRKIFVPNRGEAASRLITAVRELERERGEKIEVIVMYTQADAGAPFVVDADQAILVPDSRDVPDPSEEDPEKTKKLLAYNDVEVILRQALEQVISEARAQGLSANDIGVWPGWGFASENPELSALVTELGSRFLGPSQSAMQLVGDKIGFKRLADPEQKTWGEANNLEEAIAVSERLDYPVVIKATAGGGGEGIYFVHNKAELNAAFSKAQAGALRAFGNSTVFIEKAILPKPSDEPWQKVATQSQGDAVANELGYPLVLSHLSEEQLKASDNPHEHMVFLYDRREFTQAFEYIQRKAIDNNDDASVYINKLIAPRHVEIQLIRDQHGNCVAIGDRDCSIQWKNKKIIEEAPAPNIPNGQRQCMHQHAVRVLHEADYVGAATFEGLYDGMDFYPMEINARLQVEHTITEEVTGVDMVKEQIRVAEGYRLSVKSTPEPRGTAFEVRIYAQDADEEFAATSGTLKLFRPPTGKGIRADVAVRQGDVITAGYDPTLLKLIGKGRDRNSARAVTMRGLTDLAVDGVRTMRGFAIEVMGHQVFSDIAYSNKWLQDHYMPMRKPWEVKQYSHEALVAAAILAYRKQRSEYDNGVLATLRKGRLPKLPPRKEAEFVFALFGREYRLSVSERSGDYLVSINGRDYTVGVETKGPSGSEFNMTIDGKRVPIIGSEKQGAYPISVNGVAFTVDNPPVGEVRATQNGTVLRYEKKPGDVVNVGDVIAVLEVMKIEQPLKAQVPGILEEYLVSENAAVLQGKLLVRIKEPDDRPPPEAPQLEFRPTGETEVQRLFHATPGTEDFATCIVNIVGNFPESYREMTALLRDASLNYDPLQRLYTSVPKGFERQDELSPYAQGIFDALGHAVNQGVGDELIVDEAVKILDAFIDVEMLFQRHALRGSVERRSLFDQFDDFVQTRQVSDPAFGAILSQALSHYGVSFIDEPSERLDRALVRMRIAREETKIRRMLMLRVFDWLQSLWDAGALRGPQNKLVATLEKFNHLDREVVKLMHAAQGLLFTLDESELGKVSREDADQRVTELIKKAKGFPAGSAERRGVIKEVSSLADATILGIIDHILGNDPEAAEIAAAIRFQRLYGDRHNIEAHTLNVKEQDLYSFGIFKDRESGVRRAVVGLSAGRDPLAQNGIKNLIKRGIKGLEDFHRGATDLGAQETVDNTLELIIPELTGDMRDIERLAERIPSLIGFVDPNRQIKRITLTFVMGEAGTFYLTYRPDLERSGMFVEDVLFRGIHPYRAAQLELWRLRRHWDVERSRTPWEWNHLFKLTEKDPEKKKKPDRRLFAYSIVRHLSPQSDGNGTLRYPEIDLAFGQAIHSIRSEAQEGWAAHRIHMLIRAEVTATPEQMKRAIARLAPRIRGMQIEETNVRLMRWRPSEDQPFQDMLFRIRNPGGTGLKMKAVKPLGKPEGYVKPRSAYKLRVARNDGLGLVEAYQYIQDLTVDEGYGRGEFHELDIENPRLIKDEQTGEHRATYDITEVNRRWGNNTGKVVFGELMRPTQRHPEGIRVMQIVNDATYGLCPLQEPECARIIAAIDYAEKHGLEIDWKATSSGAGISMDKGVENLDWTALVMRRLGEFCDAGGVVNILVDGGNIGAQSYWDANATMEMTRRGVLIKVANSYTALTGNRAQMISGSVGAEDNLGLAGAERVTGPIGETQFYVETVSEGRRLLWQHHDLTWHAPGQILVDQWETSDPHDRDVTQFRYVDPAVTDKPAEQVLAEQAARAAEKKQLEAALAALADNEVAEKERIETRLEELASIPTITVYDIGEILADKEKKKPFPVAAVMASVRDQDAPVLQRWHLWKKGGADLIRVEETTIGGIPTTMIGIDAQSLPREGEIPPGYPDSWSGSTLFPEGSKKVARAINAASGRTDLVVVANLSGFDGSPESLMNNQLEWGTAIEEAVRNFKGKLAFLVTTRYHGGAYVVFSRVINDNATVGAVDNTFASVIGGNIATKLIFPRKINAAAEKLLATDASWQLRLQAAKSPQDIEKIRRAARDEVEEGFRLEYDGIHTVDKAVAVGAIHEVVPANQIRPWYIRHLSEGREVYRAQVDAQLDVWLNSFTTFAAMGDSGVAQWEKAVKSMGLGPFILTRRQDTPRSEGPTSPVPLGAEVDKPLTTTPRPVKIEDRIDVDAIKGLGEGFRPLDLGIAEGQIGNNILAFETVGVNQ